jgi:hypothetical protein
VAAEKATDDDIAAENDKFKPWDTPSCEIQKRKLTPRIPPDAR